MSEQNSNEILLASFKDTFEKISIRKYLYNIEDKTSNDSELLLDVFNTWQKVFRKRLKVNNVISEIVFDLMEESAPDIIDTMLINVEELKKFEVPKKIVFPWNQFLFKVIDHIKLIDTQQKQIIKNTKNIQAIVSFSTDRLNELQVQSENLMKKTEVINEIQKNSDKGTKDIKEIQKKSVQDTKVIKEIQDKSNNIQKEFIAILGIFASILIAAFGGLTALSSLFKKIDTTDLHKLIFVGTFEVLSIILIIFLMLNGIAKLTNLNLRSCGCKGDEKCVCELHEKHPSMVVITIILLIVLGISSIPILTKKLILANEEGYLTINLTMYGLCTVFFLILLIVFYKLNTYKITSLKKKLMKYKYANLKNREDFLSKKEQLYYEKKIYLSEKEKNLQLLLTEYNKKDEKLRIQIEKLIELEEKEIEKAKD